MMGLLILAVLAVRAVADVDGNILLQLQRREESSLLSSTARAGGMEMYNGTFGCYEVGFLPPGQAHIAPENTHGEGEGWPALPRGSLPLPLNVTVYVVSLESARARRGHFVEEWRKLDLDVPAFWTKAHDGTAGGSVPGWPNRAVFATWQSHVGIIASHEGDLLVLEDDVFFAPGFRDKLAKFLKDVPADWDILHIGGDTFWDPPFGGTADYVWTRGGGRTWGYIVRASARPRVANRILRADRKLPIDGLLSAMANSCQPADMVRTYAPPEPLVDQVPGSYSQTSQPDPAHKYAADFVYQAPPPWTASWYPTFCGQNPELHAALEESLRSSGWIEYCCHYLLEQPAYCG